ncbi:unnamed protein product, partial [Amoebophrya sp. A25]
TSSTISKTNGVIEDSEPEGTPVAVHHIGGSAVNSRNLQKASKKAPRPDMHWLRPARIDEKTRTGFVSRTFLVRYCEEEVRLNEVCVFRLWR